MHSAAAQFAAHTVVTGTWLTDWLTFWNAGKFNLMSVLMLIFTIIELRKKTDWYHEILLYREGHRRPQRNDRGGVLRAQGDALIQAKSRGRHSHHPRRRVPASPHAAL